MEIFFSTKKLAKFCNDNRAVRKQLGAKNTKFLLKRLAQLKSFDQLGYFKFDKPHPLQGNKKDQFAITIYAGSRLVFKAIEPNKDDNGNIIWAEVTKINIVYIGDYHE